jgi:hypothetical protein
MSCPLHIYILFIIYLDACKETPAAIKTGTITSKFLPGEVQTKKMIYLTNEGTIIHAYGYYQ